jgi:hypothetical protein
MRNVLWADPRAIALDLPHGATSLPLGSHPVRRGGVRHLRLNPAERGMLLRVLLSGPVESYSVAQVDGVLRVEIARPR